MAFNFGSTPTTGAGAGNNTTSAGTTASTPTFSFNGLTQNSPQPGKSSIFGGGGDGGSTSASPLSGGLFGANKDSMPKPGGSFFGSTTPSGGGLFNNPGATSKPAESSSIFTGASGSTGTQNTQASSIFTPKPAQDPNSTPAKPLFSMTSTTPAGAPPVADTSKPSGGGLFGTLSNNASSSAAPTPSAISTGASKPGGLFGNLASSTTPTSALSSNDKPSLFSGSSIGGTAATPPVTTTSGTPKLAGGLFNTSTTPSTTPTTSAPPSSAPKSLFSGLGSSTTATAPPAAAAAASASSATPATTTAATSSDTPKPTGLFGQAATSTASATPTTSTSAAPSLFSNLGAKPSGSLFGGSATATTSQSQTASTSAPATIGGLFGQKPATPAAPAASTAAQPGASSSLGTSTSGPAPQISRLKNKTMEDTITRWASDLAKYTQGFKSQANTVGTWDLKLVSNGEKVKNLYQSTYEAEKESHEIERQLQSIESQQEELEGWLNRYEGEVKDLFGRQMGQGEQLSGPDQERERMYKLAEKLSQHLEERSRDLSKMVQEINEISGTLNKSDKSEDPLSQIVRTLNGHLNQLQWIDANASALQAKVAAAQKTNTSMSNSGGLESDVSESFYRSYMGGRR